jgi:hypothetical protein
MASVQCSEREVLRVLVAFFLAAMALVGLPSGGATEADSMLRVPNGQPVAPPHETVYGIPLRVHLGQSGRTPRDFLEILQEINHIWMSQAAICFEIETVMHNEISEAGFDIWFTPDIDGSDDFNGYFVNPHGIRVRDTPILHPADHPARNPAARTAAHELGHALGLLHRQESDDNLMRSKTFGWFLSDDEVVTARRGAARMSLPGKGARACGPERLSP